MGGFGGGPAHAQVVYSVTDLGTLGGASAIAWGLGSDGTIVGQARNASNRDRPFLWEAGVGMVDLGTLGGVSGIAYDTSGSGLVVGSARNGSGMDMAFLWDAAGGMRPVPGVPPSLPSYAYGVNAAGVVVGSLYNSSGIERAFIRLPDLGLVDPFPQSPFACSARAVNALGQVAGWVTLSNSADARGYVWQDQTPVVLFGPTHWTRPHGISAGGVVVGEQSGVAAFRYLPPASYGTLPVSPFATQRANAINSNGLIVGHGVDGGNRRRGFVYGDGVGLIDLNTLIAPGSGLEITDANDINDGGVIVGAATNAAGQSRAVVLRLAHGGPVLHVRQDAVAGGNGATWATAFNSLQDAITIAALAGGDVQEIWVAGGTYLPTYRTVAGEARSATLRLLPGVEVYGGFAGFETQREQRDWIVNPTRISADLNGDDGPGFSNRQDNSWHAVTASLGQPGSTCVLDGFEVSGGNADGIGPHFDGGGIYAVSGSPVFRNMTLTGNSADHSGGGALLSFGARLESSVITGNRAFDAGGGVAARHSSVVERCEFTANSIPIGPGSGGAAQARDFAVLSRCRFVSNAVVGSGGAVELDNQSTLVNSEVRGNVASGGHGGGVVAGRDATILNCLVNGNSSSWGGGIAGGGRIINCTVVHNTASQAGGGLYGMVVPAAVTNSIVWKNISPGASLEVQQLGGPLVPVIGFSCVEGWTGSWAGAAVFGADPAFMDRVGPDLLPGTADDDLRLSSLVSPCVDSGRSASLLPDYTDLDADGDLTEYTPLDLLNAPRRADNPYVPDPGKGPAPVVDLGCYEAQPPVCYANCDGGTVPPVLNVQDFACFLNLFAAGSPGANCDLSTQQPVLNVLDFGCFLNAFAAGCS